MPASQESFAHLSRDASHLFVSEVRCALRPLRMPHGLQCLSDVTRLSRCGNQQDAVQCSVVCVDKMLMNRRDKLDLKGDKIAR